MFIAALIHLATPAFAGAPSGVPADEVDVWEERWGRLQAGPAGCWEVVGRASWDWSAGRYGASRGTSVFVGKLEDGVWKDFFIRSLGEIVEEPGHVPVHQYPHGELRFMPMFGKLAPTVRVSESGVAESLVRDLMGDLRGEVTTSWSDWNDQQGGVVLHRTVPVGIGRRSATATMNVVFPDGGELPHRLDVAMDESLPIPGWMGARLVGSDAHAQGMVVGTEVFPSVESISWTGNAIGYRAWGNQVIHYEHVRPCGMPAFDTPKSIL